MTSQINYNTIDSTFPVAGQDNSSQGFRDNFQSIKNNFETAYTEISALQANAVLAGQSSDLGGSIIANAVLSGARELLNDLGSVYGPVAYDFNKGSYQIVALTGSITVSFTNVSGINDAVTIRLGVVVPNTAFTITWPAAVNKNVSSLDNQQGQVSHFSNTGYYEFQLTTVDGGVTWTISETTRNRNSFQGNVDFYTVISNTSVSGVNITVANVGGTVIGNVHATNFFGNFVGNGTSAAFSGNVNADHLIAETGIAGNVLTPIQANITTLGNLTSLQVDGITNVGDLTASGMTDMCGGTRYGVQYVNTAVDGATTQLWGNIGFAVIGTANGSISSHTLLMPATPLNGQELRLAFSNAISTLHMTAINPTTVYGALGSASSGTGGTWIYHNTTDAWYKVG